MKIEFDDILDELEQNIKDLKQHTKELSEAIDTFEKVVKNKRWHVTSKHFILKQLKQLEVVVINLKIESKRLREPNSIDVIADKIEKVIEQIEQEVVDN